MTGGDEDIGINHFPLPFAFMFLREEFFNSLSFWTVLSILLVRWMTLEVEREVSEVGMTSYCSRCALNRDEKISAAYAVEVSSEARHW